ncbi:MICOS complex subunit Mic60 isoform X2 [Hermetia illucens]|uniref:MICOS complex subunit Mic60 isoform X2 n=1 Tax=Hermetia illucens TaxID=343691 RepID=UPI0018CC4599|nr:MICOS complex subunit Mic60 isoform X2 [Hermetia illucens]
MYRFVLRNPCKNAVQKTLTHYIRRHNSSGVPRQAGFGKILVIITPFVAVGGVATYAKYDDEFRKTLVKNVPGADSILKVVLQEENPFEDVSKKFSSVTSSVTGLFGGGDSQTSDTKPKKVEITEVKLPTQKPVSISSSSSSKAPSSQSDSIIPVPLPPITSDPTKTTATATKQEKKESTASTATPAAAPSKPITVSKPTDSIPSDIQELEKAVELAAALAVEEYNKAIGVLKSYNEEIKKVVDHAIEKLDPTAWIAMKNKTSARDTTVEHAENSARDALNKMDQCQAALSKHANTVSAERLDAIRNKIRTLNDHINGRKDELYRTKDSAVLSEKYWKKVESARNYFLDEIAAIFPGLNLAEKKLNLNKDDLDLFITHAYSHVLAYQKELQRLQLEGEMRLKRAIDALRGEDQTEAVRAQVDFYLEKERRDMALENQKKVSRIIAESEKELKKQLKRQSEAHVDHLHDALTQKETELRRTFMRELDEKISTEKAAYKLQLASMLGKLKGMDAALKARAESERCAHQAQALWAACQALWASVRTGDPGVHWQLKLRPLSSEIKAVGRAAAEGDELVTVVLQSLPKEALARGVYPEDALRERFINVERVARKVALVPEEGASLPVYLLSYLQSMLIMRPDNPISQEELENKVFDFSKLDTYDVLNRARYFLDRGDLTQAVKYLNLLQGAPRKVANDWLKEARLLLETQQASNTLMAHAAASGLLYL